MKINFVSKKHIVKLFIVINFILIFFSCKNKEVKLCSTISNRCISIIDNGNIRYIYYNQISSRDYVKLDISNVDYESDGIFICWNNKSNKLEVINPKARIIEVKFDSSIYQFSNIHEVDSIGIPKVLKFHKNGNIEFNMGSKSIFPLDANVKMGDN